MAAVEASSASNAIASNDTHSKTERCCDNADCNVAKLVTLVPKRKTSQFVTEPCVMEKPMLINGFTTVFQIDGTAAKLSDLKGSGSASNAAANAQKPVYRIKPNTHVHVINYVVVDDNGDTLRRINDSDPEIMRKLLDSQKKSAEMKLKKLLLHSDGLKVRTLPPGAVVTAGPAATTAPAVANNVVQPKLPTQPSAVTAGSAAARLKLISAPSLKPQKLPTTPAAVAPAANLGTSAAIQLPMRTHPNLKITAVTSGESLNQLPTPALAGAAVGTVATAVGAPVVSLEPPLLSPASGMPSPSQLPLITPVPLSTLQNVVVEKNSFDKMQAEIQELRRTVTMLAEAQAKTQHTSVGVQQTALPTLPGTTSAAAGVVNMGLQQRGLKRPRSNI